MHGYAQKVWKFKAQLLSCIPTWITHWQPLPRNVRACEAQCCCHKRHSHCGPSILRSLTSLPGGPLCRSLRLRCALLKQRTFARVCLRTVFHADLFFYRIRCLSVFYNLPVLFLQGLQKANGMSTLARRRATLLQRSSLWWRQ